MAVAITYQAIKMTMKELKRNNELFSEDQNTWIVFMKGRLKNFSKTSLLKFYINKSFTVSGSYIPSRSIHVSTGRI